MHIKWSLSLVLTLSLGAAISGEYLDTNDIERFCYPDAHKNTRRSCECSNESAPPWGMRAVRVDCSFKDLRSKDLGETLPLYVDTIDLSWNALDQVPVFASDSLRLLNLMHNNISALTSKNFIRISNLRELYLSWNGIQTIEQNAFVDLAHLQVLDLSHNNLHALRFQIFAPLLILETLSLSWNRQLNRSEGIQELDFYQNYGVNGKLRTLKLEACSLTNVVLPEKAPLAALDMRRNQLTHLPQNLPNALQKLDISDNLLEALLPSDTAKLMHVQELYLEDMPRLKSVAENAFVPLQSLQKVSFQNSRRLSSFDAAAFGANITTASTQSPPSQHPIALRSMIFRGTTLRTFNRTLAPVFRQLTELDLNGMPLHCDCELIWVKQLGLETNGRCFRPSRLRGMRLSNARASDFSCDTWPQWVYGVIVLGLIVLCSVGIYLIVMCMRPHRGRVTMRRKVGAGSPYARVTIEPNRQENTHY